MAHRSRRRIYETAFDSKVEKHPDDGSLDLLDRIANHPILQLLNPRRRSRPHTAASNNNRPCSRQYAGQNLNTLYNDNTVRPVPPKAKFQGGGTPRCGRRGARARVSAPTRSLSSHYITGSALRPIGLSKSDDQILSRVSDSPDDEDCLEDYIEGQQAEDLARDLITLHLSVDDYKKEERIENAGEMVFSCKHTQKLITRDRFRRCNKIGASGRGVSVDGRVHGACTGYRVYDDNTQSYNNKNDIKAPTVRSTSILALHHPNVSSPRLQHQGSSVTSSPRVYHSNSPRLLHSSTSSPRFSHSAASSPKVFHSSATQSPRLPHSALSSPKLQHVRASNTQSYKLVRTFSPRMPHSTSAAIARVLQGSCDSSSAPSIQTNDSINVNSKLSIDEPSTSGYSSNKMYPSTKSSLRELERSEGLAKLKPLELHSPPGTAPLPVKFIKKTPLSDRSPSSWFSPPRQKDLSLPIKRSSQSRSSSSDASSSDRGHSKSRSRNTSASGIVSKCEYNGRGLGELVCKTGSGRGGGNASSGDSLNSSMEVLVDTVSQSGLSLPTQVNVKTSYFSLDSMVSGDSSMESLKSSMSEGSKSVADGSVAGGSGGGAKWRSMGSNTSLPLRPSLLLPASHRSLIQSAKFQILSPISDKSQEPSSTDTVGPNMIGCGLIGGGSQRTSPQDLLQQTPVQPRNISEDFRNVHHILPQTPSGVNKAKLPGSDSGISIEYATQHRSTSQASHSVLKDLPFDMPKLRRRLAAARSCPSTSNSSLTSSGERSLNVSTALNPAIFRLQTSDCRSGTSSSNSSDWDVRSSAGSSNEGTPSKGALGRKSLALDLGGTAVTTAGEKVDVSLHLAKQTWYHGNINRSSAEDLLRNQGEGTYLVRSIDTPRREYSVALKAACGFMHLKIQYHGDNNGFKVGRGAEWFPSVPHVIHHHSIHRLPIKGAENLFLKKPIISETL